MFEVSAKYYDKFYDFLDYATAASRLRSLIAEHHPRASSLLDVGCGTGRYLEHLQGHYRVTGLDILPGMIEQVIQRCPGVPAHVGDMTDFDLGEQFDVVTCLFCSIGYMRTAERMTQAMRRMAAHVAPGGLLIVEPWIAPQQCWTDRINCEVHDRERDLKIVRMHTYERTARSSIYDIHYLVGTPREVQHFVEREELGLFTIDEYQAAMNDAGLDAVHLDTGLFPDHAYGIHLGVKTHDTLSQEYAA